MIKKCIASILIILIFINSIGCVSYKSAGIDDKNEIEEAKEIRLTTVDNKEYHLTNITVTDSTISGNQWLENKTMEGRIEFPTEQILKIEVEYNHMKTAVSILVFVGIGAVILGIFAVTWSPKFH